MGVRVVLKDLLGTWGRGKWQVVQSRWPSSSLMNVYQRKISHGLYSRIRQAGLAPDDTCCTLGLSGFFFWLSNNN